MIIDADRVDRPSFLTGGRNLGQVAVPAMHAISQNRGLRRLSVARRVSAVSSRRRDEYNIKTSKNVSEPARSFLAITRKKRPLYDRVLSEEIDRGIIRPCTTGACEFREAGVT